MNNEPVAWMMVNRENTSAYLTFEKPTRDMKISHEPNPLYTHPVKKLTDEEIMNIFNNWTNSKQEHNLPANNQNYFYQEMLGFARAILKKAQE